METLIHQSLTLEEFKALSMDEQDEIHDQVTELHETTINNLKGAKSGFLIVFGTDGQETLIGEPGTNMPSEEQIQSWEKARDLPAFVVDFTPIVTGNVPL